MSQESLPTNQLRFIVPDHERITETHTVLSGSGELQAGTVLAKDSNNADKLVPVDSQSATPSIQTPFGVLAAGTVNATSGDAEALVFVKGYFQHSGLTFGGTDTADDHRDALRSIGIYIRED
jgi:hypothetical protein